MLECVVRDTAEVAASHLEVSEVASRRPALEDLVAVPGRAVRWRLAVGGLGSLDDRTGTEAHQATLGAGHGDVALRVSDESATGVDLVRKFVLGQDEKDRKSVV